MVRGKAFGRIGGQITQRRGAVKNERKKRRRVDGSLIL